MGRDAFDWFIVCMLVGLGSMLGLVCWLTTRVWFWMGAFITTIILQGGIAP